MSETTSLPPVSRRFDFKRLFAFPFQPRRHLAEMIASEPIAWQMPMLFLSLALVLRLLVSGYFQAQAAAMGQVPLPPDWQWWTPEMQNNYMQAIQQTQSPVFVYVIPMVLGLSGLWLGWLVLAGLLHLASTLLGGRGAMGSALGLTAWASIPFALRDLLRVVFMLAAGRAIASPGLSGFVTATDAGAVFLAQILANVDIFFFWHLFLLVLAFRLSDSLSGPKAAAGVFSVLILSLLAQAGLGTLASRLGGLMVTRQF
ncbi:MAG: YIP1 family protein [Anaerolineales bacterium]|nr:YIP1 family protein [Anaerolineales bacterium]MCX7754511.1 YIP1 family protein [Anaerolineales bacterium]MDW8277133.1 Yip1 family protein [Anaerolineales bacterium]